MRLSFCLLFLLGITMDVTVAFLTSGRAGLSTSSTYSVRSKITNFHKGERDNSITENPSPLTIMFSDNEKSVEKRSTALYDDSVFENGFIVDKMNPEVTDLELDERNIVKIVRSECTDQEVNMLVWKCLGYVYNPEGTEDNSNAVSKWYENVEKVEEEGIGENNNDTNEKEKEPQVPKAKWTPPPFPENPMWRNDKVFPKWREKYPSPPDVLGLTRNYERENDQHVKRANNSIVRSIPRNYKQSLKELLAPFGFTGYKINELTPNKTRRAQVANWLLYYKRTMWGVSLEELIRRKNENVDIIPREGESEESLKKKMVY